MAGGARAIVGDFRHVTWALLAAIIAACATQASPDADTGVDTSADAAPCTVEPHLKSIETNYFSQSCALSGCHDSAVAWQGNLDLSTGNAWKSLVNQPAFQPKAKADGKLLVVPGHPEQSFLYEKLTQTSQGVLMPYNATAPYDPDCSIAAVRMWIENGALND